MSKSVNAKDYPDLFDPPVMITKILEDRLEFTPDFREMRRYKSIPVFVYHPHILLSENNNSFLSNFEKECHYLGRGHSTMNKFVLYDDNDRIDGWHIAFEVNTMIPKNSSPMLGSHLSGEVYGVSPVTLLHMDSMLLNTKMFERRLRSITLLDQEIPLKSGIGRPTLQCWVYFGIQDYWDQTNLYRRGTAKYDDKKWVWVNKRVYN